MQASSYKFIDLEGGCDKEAFTGDEYLRVLV